MSSIKKLTKKTLVELANDLGISNQLSEKTDLKQDYVEKIEQFANANPGASSIIAKHLLLFKTKSPKKPVINGSDIVSVESSSDEEVEGEKDSEVFVDEENFDFKKYVKIVNDKTVEVYESAVDKVSDNFSSLIDFGVEKSDLLREQSSSPFTLALLESFAEYSYLYFHYVDLTTIGRSKAVPKLIKDNLPKEVLKLPIVSLGKLFQYDAITVFTLWTSIAVFIPLIVSFFVNFTKPTKKASFKYTFDPFIFALTKFLLVLFALRSEISVVAVKDDFVYKFFGGSIFKFAQSFILDGDLQLRSLFGTITLISSIVTALVSFYAVVGK